MVRDSGAGVEKQVIMAFTECLILWIPLESVFQLFEGINAILFLVASSDYDQTLREETSVNRLREAVSLFDDVWQSRWEKVNCSAAFCHSTDTWCPFNAVTSLFLIEVLRRNIILDITDNTHTHIMIITDRTKFGLVEDYRLHYKLFWYWRALWWLCSFLKLYVQNMWKFL